MMGENEAAQKGKSSRLQKRSKEIAEGELAAARRLRVGFYFFYKKNGPPTWISMHLSSCQPMATPMTQQVCMYYTQAKI